MTCCCCQNGAGHPLVGLVLPWLWLETSLWTCLWSAENQVSSVSPCQLSHMLSSIECKACYHKSCFKSSHCPRCERLQARRELLAKQSMESYVSDYEDELEQPEVVAAT